MNEAFAIFWFVFLTTAYADPTIVHTKSGPVLGKEVQISPEKNMIIYLGIPYAKAPVGPLRFRPPEAAEPWTEVLNATSLPRKCIQHNVTGVARGFDSPETTGEDCLTLNIMGPGSEDKNLPVLVYIHGGAFSVGHAANRIEPLVNMVTEEKLIVASMNYRLNVFGFLGLGIPDAPGNVGLMDQRLALVWIKDNIQAFGGDPNRITLWGLSAGSTSTGYHILNHSNKGLFHGAIMMSGAIQGNVKLEPEHLVLKSRALAASVGCSHPNITHVAECLQIVDVKHLLSAEVKIRRHLVDFFKPSVDGIYVTEDPLVSLERQRYSPVPLLIGTTSNEGGRFALGLNRDIMSLPDGALSPENFETVIERVLGQYANEVTIQAAEIFYRDFSNPDDEYMLRDAAAHAYGDNIFVCGVNHFSDKYTTGGVALYKYVYDQKIFRLTSTDWLGPEHSADLAVVTGYALSPGMLSDEETNFSRRLMKMWSSFARNGDPNIGDEDSPVWPKYNVIRRPYMRLAFRPEVQEHFRAKECQFWNDLLPTIRCDNTQFGNTPC